MEIFLKAQWYLNYQIKLEEEKLSNE